MDYQDAVSHLKNHADHDPGSDTRSLLVELWQADRRKVFPEIQVHVADIVECLVVANLELNGPIPSSTSERANPAVVHELAGAVTSLVVGLLDAHRRWALARRFPPAVLDALRDGALRISMAWDMALAGDRDNLLQDLEREWSAVN